MRVQFCHEMSGRFHISYFCLGNVGHFVCVIITGGGEHERVCVCFLRKAPRASALIRRSHRFLKLFKAALGGAQGSGASIFPHAAASLPCFFSFLLI